VDREARVSWNLMHTGMAIAFIGVLLLAFAGWDRWRDYQ